MHILNFIYTKTEEKKRLLDIYDEYQWFLDNNFPVILPKFYASLYKKCGGDKKLFAREASRELDKIYASDIYRQKFFKIKDNWRGIEAEVFDALKKLKLKAENKYICNISLYGPEGQFQRPNIINLRANAKKDIRTANETIVHELIHLLIYNKVKRMKLSYEKTEGLVDSFFTKVELKRIFPRYKKQSIIKY